MQAVSISFFRFDRLDARLWAFGQMQWARAPLFRLPGIGFAKLFGTGTRESFHPYPNFGVYAIMATWPSLDHARDQVRSADLFERYRGHASESWTVYLSAIKAWGQWDGREPFEVETPAKLPMPIGILTRASIKKRHLITFWKDVPPISEQTTRESGLMFKMGMGEIPWIHQVTFSVWETAAQMREFAYKSPSHGVAAKKAHDQGWFHEQLFARFAILESEGSWQGADPLLMPARHRSQATATADARAA